jgi:hypothetical protein
MAYKLHISKRLSGSMREFLIRMIFLNELKLQRIRRLPIGQHL